MEHRNEIVLPDLWHTYSRQLLDIPQITAAISENFKISNEFQYETGFLVVNYIQNTYADVRHNFDIVSNKLRLYCFKFSVCIYG